MRTRNKSTEQNPGSLNNLPMGVRVKWVILWVHLSFFSHWSAEKWKKKRKVHTHSDSFSLSTEGLTPLVLETLPAHWEITGVIIGGEVGRTGSWLKDTPPSSPPSLGLLLPSTSQKCADFLAACISSPQKNTSLLSTEPKSLENSLACPSFSTPFFFLNGSSHP